MVGWLERLVLVMQLSIFKKELPVGEKWDEYSGDPP